MGFLKRIGNKLADGLLKSIVKSSGVESLNPYIGMLIKANPEDLIADEKFRLAIVLKNGYYGVFQNDIKAKEYCRMAAEEGHPGAMVMYVQWLMSKPDDASSEILDWLSKAAELGEKQALYNLAISYHRGDFGKPDLEKAYKLFRKSAERCYIESYPRLAMIHYNGDDGVEKSQTIAKFFAFDGLIRGNNSCRELLDIMANEEEKATGQIIRDKVFENASNSGEPLATVAIANFKAIEDKDKEGAIELLKSVTVECLQKDEVLGLLLWESQKYDEALLYIEKAAPEGFDYAQFILALAYYKGLGKEKDIEKALGWVIKSLNLGNKNARKLFAEMIMSNDLQELLPDKVMRGPSYLELANNTAS